MGEVLSTFQQRIGRKHDLLRRKIIDNNMRLISDAVDCLRVKTRKTFEGDDTSLIVESCEVINAVFPKMKDLPFRKVKIDQMTQQWQLTSLVGMFEEGEQEKHFTLHVPYRWNVDTDDLICRVFIDDAQNYPIIIVIQVKELLGTFGTGQLIMQKCICTIPTIDLPQEVISTLQQMSRRRLTVGF